MKASPIQTTIYSACMILLILLWSYTALSKLADFELFKYQMFAQKFDRSLATILIYTLPYLELGITFGFLNTKKKAFAWMGSTVLLFVFTIYMAMVYMGWYQRVPCSCGGVIKSFSFKGHFYFNLFFLIISLLGTVIYFKSFKKEVNSSS